ncbi:class C sortase [Enemella evansiae]|uniref:class C sortase n=1 Tax=Enemella evansiae TaxID=2016499 RepID=UPI000B964FAF|nr:class C sortase [Enemella evansiae]OYO06810.1 class C sortase [Enemella evansiae]OYO19746.1 class C sortase [Enemella evansiae]TDO91620.1 sortase A [Enemella evansiae]
MSDTQVRTSSGPRRAVESRRKLHRLIPILLVIAGVMVLLYPVAATQFNNIKQRQFAQQYNQQVDKLSDADRIAELERARAYNSTLAGVPILDPYLERASNPESGAYRDYQSQLARFEMMARVRVPSAGIDLPIYHGTSDEVIAKGAGHLYGTSLPVGGAGTHSVLTSHTGMSNATLFDHLTSVKQGDLIYIDVMGETLAYRVDQIKVVLPTEIGDLKAVPGKDYVTLFTCTPYAINTHRLLVRAERVPDTPTAADRAAQAAPGFTLEPWMWWLILGASVGLLVAILIAVREWRRRRANRVQGARVA